MNLKPWFDSWWATASLWEAIKFWIPTLISLCALGYVLYDRRAHIVLKAKRGDWYVLYSAINANEIVFAGVIEIYNASSRANAIREYEFLRHDSGNEWVPMESEQYNLEPSAGKAPEIHNQTALTLAPYSGIEVKVQAIAKVKERPYEMLIKIVVEDLFEKRYTLDVKATMK